MRELPEATALKPDDVQTLVGFVLTGKRKKKIKKIKMQFLQKQTERERKKVKDGEADEQSGSKRNKTMKRLDEKEKLKEGG